MNCEEAEFLAENVSVTIVPSFSEKVWHLVCDDVGPFEPGIAVKVPLWLAVYLRDRHKCRIVCPDWMQVENLERLLTDERESPFFTEVPEHYKEITHVLVRKAPQDVDDCDRVKTLIQDLWDCRIAKLKTSTVQFVQQGGSRAQVQHLTQLEITVIRPFLAATLDYSAKLRSSAYTIGLS